MQHLMSLTRKHWKTYLPKMTASLKAEGKLEQALQVAVSQAANRIRELMESGYQQHEAEEVARAEFLILNPEPPDSDDPEEQELMEMEREYRKQMAD